MNGTLLLSAIAATASAAEPIDTLRLVELQDVVVKGVTASKEAPFAVTNVKEGQLKAFATEGRELPYLFQRTPGVLAWGENGLGTGTAYMRIRGAAGSRINVTLDGVPLNSPEDQTVFWANMNSYASLLRSAQIQRGIGTSTNGDGAFGGTVSLATAVPQRTPSAEVTASYGSYGTLHLGGAFSTGLMFDHLIFNGAYNETQTDGFVHGTQGRSGSYYGGLTWLGDNFQLSYKNIGNFEKTGQAWNGVTAGDNNLSLMDGTYGAKTGITSYRDLYRRGLGKYNTLYESLAYDYNGYFRQDANGNYVTERYRLRDGSLWDKTTDNFYQNHNILSAQWQPAEHWSHNLALHYTYGFGYYAELRPNNKLKKFGLSPFTLADGSELSQTDFIRKKGITQHTYGAIYNVNYRDEAWEVTGGVNLQHFDGTHWGFLTYIANQEMDAAMRPGGRDYKYYDSDAQKRDYSGFMKAAYHFGRGWTSFLDLQYRFVHYKTSGINDKFVKSPDGKGYANQQLHVNERYNFVNPKAGISYAADGHHAFASIAYANREPERNNFTDNGSYGFPSPERLMDIETGYDFTGRNWHAGLTGYYMDYVNQFVQTGAQSDIGENLTTNVRGSYRLGVELQAGWSPARWLSLEGNAALSKNRISDFDEVVEDWAVGSQTIHYDHSTLAFSPSAILNGFLNVHHKGFEAEWHTNYVSRQHLDNTGSKERALPWYTQSNARLSYTFSPNASFCGVKEAVVSLMVSNVFDRHYATSGWVYSAISEADGHSNSNRYYQIGFVPQAGRTLMGSLTLRF